MNSVHEHNQYQEHARQLLNEIAIAVIVSASWLLHCWRSFKQQETEANLDKQTSGDDCKDKIPERAPVPVPYNRKLDRKRDRSRKTVTTQDSTTIGAKIHGTQGDGHHDGKQDENSQRFCFHQGERSLSPRISGHYLLENREHG